MIRVYTRITLRTTASPRKRATGVSLGLSNTGACSMSPGKVVAAADHWSRMTQPTLPRMCALLRTRLVSCGTTSHTTTRKKRQATSACETKAQRAISTRSSNRCTSQTVSARYTSLLSAQGHKLTVRRPSTRSPRTTKKVYKTAPTPYRDSSTSYKHPSRLSRPAS